MVGGPKLRVEKAADAFVELANASGYAFAVMPSAKGYSSGAPLSFHWSLPSCSSKRYLEFEFHCLYFPDEILFI